MTRAHLEAQLGHESHPPVATRHGELDVEGLAVRTDELGLGLGLELGLGLGIGVALGVELGATSGLDAGARLGLDVAATGLTAVTGCCGRDNGRPGSGSAFGVRPGEADWMVPASAGWMGRPWATMFRPNTSPAAAETTTSIARGQGRSAPFHSPRKRRMTVSAST